MFIDKTMEAIRNSVQADTQEHVHIAVFGQPGAGKSSLINSLLGGQAAVVGVGNDTTRTANIYEYNGLYFADLPGYDTERFAADEYLQRFDILAYDAFLCIFNGKLHAADINLWQQVQSGRDTCLLVRTGLDTMFAKHKNLDTLKQDVEQDVAEKLAGVAKVYFVSNRTGGGLEELVVGLENLLPLAKRERFVRGVKARSDRMLADKYLACEKLVAKYAWLAAANAVNPLPGLDISIDLKIMNNMFDEIKCTYGLDQAKLDKFRGVIPMAERVIALGTKEGMLVVMKGYIGKQGVEGLAKYIPYAGQAVAMGIGYALTSNLGKRYLDDCQALATDVLQSKLADW